MKTRGMESPLEQPRFYGLKPKYSMYGIDFPPAFGLAFAKSRRHMAAINRARLRTG
jgi:hypothetical protein